MNTDPLQSLIDLMATLRSPQQGCPWDRQQTLQSLTPHTLEECYELIDAIETGEQSDIKDELGDLLFQIAFYAQICSENQQFDLNDVIHHLVAKMRRRHPHVFADKKFDTQAQLNQAWEEIKRTEKSAKKSAAKSIIDDVPTKLPALVKAQKIQKKAARSGFDWPHTDQFKAKISEEINELDEAIASDDQAAIEHEIGDLLLSCVSLSRHLNVDAEQALRSATTRYSQRFKYIETVHQQADKQINQSSIEELLALWQQAKSQQSESY